MEHHLAIVEDNPSVRESISLFVQAKTQFPVVGEFGSVEDFLSNDFGQVFPSLLVLDVGLPGMSGIEGILHIKKKFPLINIVMLTTFEEEEKIFEALRAGACSYISKRTPLIKIMEALNIVANGGSYMSPSIARKVASFFNQQTVKDKVELSDRQKEIVSHIVEGKSYREIAELCFISLNTVRTHIKRIYENLQINSKVGLITKYHKGEL